MVSNDWWHVRCDDGEHEWGTGPRCARCNLRRGAEGAADAGTPQSAPAPTQAATEAHSDDEQWSAKCDGYCNPMDGWDEECARHGRPLSEVWQMVKDQGRWGTEQWERAEAAEAKVARVESLIANLHTDLAYVGDIRAALDAE